jgi:putative ABC transport system permease protein
VFQFSISIGLAVCTMVIYAQTLYARNMDVGYDFQQKLILSGLNSSAVRDQKDVLVSELERIPGVSSVVLSSEAPSQDNENNTGFRVHDSTQADSINDAVILNYYTVGYDFFEAYDMEIIAGRTFNRNYGSDAIEAIPENEERIGKASVVINESAVTRLGFPTPADAIGKTLRADVSRAGEHDLQIVGVAKDVHYRSIKFGIRSSVFFLYPRNLRVATISFTGNPDTVTEATESVWQAFAPSTPVRHRFLDDMIYEQYREEEKQAQLLAVFSVLAVLIACLGLFGLAAFTAERRTREIGIRKVMGARIRDIVTLLIWQFSIPVLIANIVAWPLAWFFMNDWLQNFTYRIDSTYIVLASITAGLAALLIAWLTVASRAFRIASANPIAALRYE